MESSPALGTHSDAGLTSNFTSLFQAFQARAFTFQAEGSTRAEQSWMVQVLDQQPSESFAQALEFFFGIFRSLGARKEDDCLLSKLI